MELTVKKKAIGLVCLIAVVCSLVALVAVASAFGSEDKPASVNAAGTVTVPISGPVAGAAEHDTAFGAGSFAACTHEGATPFSGGGTLESGHYYLTQNITCNTRIMPDSTVDLCLNGYMINGNGGSCFNIMGSTILNIFDHEWQEGDSRDHYYTVDSDGRYVFSDSVSERYIRGGVIANGDIYVDPAFYNACIYFYGGAVCGHKGGSVVRSTNARIFGGLFSGNSVSETVIKIESISGDKVLSFKGGVVTDNTGGCGVTLFNEIFCDISGNTVIFGNKTAGGESSNLKLNSGDVIDVGELTQGAKIGVTINQSSSSVITKNFSVNNPGKNALDFFESDNAAILSVNASGDVVASATNNAWKTADFTPITKFYGQDISSDCYTRFPFPSAVHGGITVEYYTDEALTQKYAGELYDNLYPTTAMPAGTYYLKIINESSVLYNSIEPLVYNKETSPQYVCTITPRLLTVKADDLTSDYGEPLKELTYSITEGTVVNNDALNITLTKAEGITAKGYAITGEYNNPNYAITITPGTYTIAPRSVTVLIDDKTSVYGDPLAEMTFTLNDGSTLAYDETLTDLQITLTKAVGDDASEYAITGECGNGNYNVTFMDGTYTITQATNAWETELTMSGWTYGATAGEPSATPKFGEVVYTYSDSADGTFGADKPTNAGTYFVKAEVTETNNYAGLTSTVEFTIAKATYNMNSVVFESVTAIYNGNAYSVEVTGLPNGVSVEYDKERSYTNAGTYTVKATFTAADTTNYNALAITEMTATLTINKADYDMSGAGWNYTEAFTYDGTEKTVEVTGLPTGVTVEAYTNNTATNAGEYTAGVTLAYENEANYNAPTLDALTWTINKADYDMSGADWNYTEAFTFDGTEKTVEVTGLPTGVTVEVYTGNTATNAGEYTASVTLAYENEANYNAPTLDALTWTINKADYDMSGAGWNYTEAFTFDGTEKTVEVTGLPTGVTAVYTGNTATNAGDYTASVTFTYDETNYNTPTIADLNWKIEKATYDMSGAGWNYTDAYTYDSTEKSVEITGLPTGVTAVYTGNTATNAGEYTASVALTYDETNYNAPTIADLAWTIDKATYDMTGAGWNYTEAFTYDGTERR